MVTQYGAGLYFEESKSHTISEKHVVIRNTESVDQLFPMPLIHRIQKMASTALASMLPKYPAKHFKKASRMLADKK